MKIWVKIILVILVISLPCCAYQGGKDNKLEKLVDERAAAIVEEIKQADSSIVSEIEALTAQKEELNKEISAKSDVITAIQKYNTDKTDYNEQIAQLNGEIEDLNTSIDATQEEIAKRAEQKRLAAELEKTTIVWVGDSGNRYHSEYCRTLKGNKHQMTLAQAKAQGRTACGVCGG